MIFPVDVLQVASVSIQKPINLKEVQMAFLVGKVNDPMKI